MHPSNRKNASDVWSVMVKTVSGVAKCSICQGTFKCDKGTSNLKRHILKQHPDRLDSQRASSRGDDQEISGTPSTSVRMVQPTVGSTVARTTYYASESDKKKAVDEKLFQLVYKDILPFTVVEGEGFPAFVNELNPRYQIPSRRELARELPKVYAAEKEKLITLLGSVDRIAITTDAWTSVQTESYLTLTAHFIKPSPSWSLQSTVLATRPLVDHSAAGTAKEIKTILEEFEISQKISSVVTDNASWMVALVKDHLKVHHVRCFAHTLNLIVKDSLQNSTDLTSLIAAVKTIVRFFHHSPKASAKLVEVQGDLKRTKHKLIQDVETRWNSTLKMLTRYAEEHRAVTGALLALNRTDIILPDSCLEQIQSACHSLEPFFQATVEMSTENTTSLSKMLPVVRQIQDYLKKEPESALRNQLLTQLQKRFINIEENFTLSAATLLDSGFKRIPFSDREVLRRQEDRLVNMLKPLFSQTTAAASSMETEEHGTVEAAPPPPKKKSLWDSFEDKVEAIEKSAPQTLTGPLEELKRYPETSHLRRTEDPLQWWSENSALFPKLSVLALHFLHVPATSVPSEGLFSKAGQLVSLRRSCLKSSTIDMVLFLNKQNIE